MRAIPTVPRTASLAAAVLLLTGCAGGDDATAGGWPALASGYACAAAPQGALEERLEAEEPASWHDGVRAVSATTFALGRAPGDPPTPAPLAQCVDGDVYRGTDAMPLGFRGVPADPWELPTDAVRATLEAVESGTPPAVDPTTGGYTVTITENYGLLRGRDGITDADDTTLVISRVDDGSLLEVGGGEPRRFADADEAWAWIEAHGFTPHADGARTLHPGEIALVTMLRETGETDSALGLWDEYVLDPATGEWVPVDRGR